MSFVKFLAILLLIQLVLSAKKGCSSVSPDSESDCVLTSSDKEKGKVYCCYEEFAGFKGCTAYTEEEYQEEKEDAEWLGKYAKMICSTKVGEARFMNLSIKTLILLVLLNL